MWRAVGGAVLQVCRCAGCRAPCAPPQHITRDTPAREHPRAGAHTQTGTHRVRAAALLAPRCSIPTGMTAPAAPGWLSCCSCIEHTCAPRANAAVEARRENAPHGPGRARSTPLSYDGHE
jgi:hypothetical protein